jgi:hypothetical protein
MSFSAMSLAISQNLPTKEKFILLMMANYADENLHCYPSITRLCSDTGMSKDSVIRAIKGLEERGLVSVRRQKQNGVNLCNSYDLNLRVVVAVSDHQTGEGVVANSGEGSRCERHKPIIEPINIDSISPTPPEKADNGFEQFWEAYPRRIGKAAAEKAYARAVKIKDRETLLKAASIFATQRKGKDVQFTPHPATWLNQGRWDDEEIKKVQLTVDNLAKKGMMPSRNFV